MYCKLVNFEVNVITNVYIDISFRGQASISRTNFCHQFVTLKSMHSPLQTRTETEKDTRKNLI